MPLRQLALWMKMVRPLALSRGPSGRRLPGTDSASHAQTRHANGRSRSGWPGSLRSPDECAPPMFRWLLSSSGTGDRPTETLLSPGIPCAAGCLPCSPSGAYIRCSCAVIPKAPRPLPGRHLPRGNYCPLPPHNIPIYVTGEGIPRARGGVAQIVW
jgi:hypothetical protein